MLRVVFDCCLLLDDVVGVKFVMIMS